MEQRTDLDHRDSRGALGVRKSNFVRLIALYSPWQISRSGAVSGQFGAGESKPRQACDARTEQ